MSHVLMVIAAKDFRDEEYFDTKTEIISFGHKVTTASTQMHATGSKGGETNVDVLLQDCSAKDFDAVVFVGGAGSYNYFEDKTALSLARSFYAEGKITAAICAAPAILAHAGLLENKNFTSFSGVTELIESKGGHYIDASVVEDGLLVTSQGPQTARYFGQTLGKLL